jgi:hypothetical protein
LKKKFEKKIEKQIWIFYFNKLDFLFENLKGCESQHLAKVEPFQNDQSKQILSNPRREIRK